MSKNPFIGGFHLAEHNFDNADFRYNVTTSVHKKICVDSFIYSIHLLRNK